MFTYVICRYITHYTIHVYSLGAGVAALLVYLLRDRVPGIRAVVFGCPACVDEVTADALKDRYALVCIYCSSYCGS